MLFSLVAGYLVDKYLNSKNKVAITQYKNKGKAGTSLNCFAPGLEISPADGENVVNQDLGGSFIVSIGGVNQLITPDVERGERRIYSVSPDGTEIKSILKLKNDGTMILNGGSDSAVLFSELKTAYDELKTDFNNLVSLYNAHIHPTPAGPSSVTVSIGSPSVADISGAESVDVKLS